MKQRLLKEKKCKNAKCKKTFQPRTVLQYVCSISCAVERSAALADKKFKQECATDKKAWYEKHKSLGQYELEARKPFQAWIRRRDANRSCISCGNDKTDQWDAGHYFKAELYSGLIFCETNVHKQCKQCNHHYHGNDVLYRQGLIERYGEEFVKNLEALALVNRSCKYTKQELIDIKDHYNNLLKQKP